ncbi:MAG: Holliday junction resolvase RuvX [Christensenellales bacterium]
MNRTGALDVGDKRIGIAVSDLLGITAQGIATYERTGKKDAQNILDIFAKLDVSRIVVGMPRNMNGTYGPQSEKVRAFAGQLAKLTKSEIVFFDERLTTKAAERILIQADVKRKKRKSVIDKLAAVCILQNYLDSHE